MTDELTFDPMAGAGVGVTLEQRKRLWHHEEDAKEQTPWRVYQRPVGNDNDALASVGLQFAPREWKCTHNRGFATPEQAGPELALRGAGECVIDPGARMEVTHEGQCVRVGQLRLIIATIDGEVAALADAKLGTLDALKRSIDVHIQVRNNIGRH